MVSGRQADAARDILVIAEWTAGGCCARPPAERRLRAGIFAAKGEGGVDEGRSNPGLKLCDNGVTTGSYCFCGGHGIVIIGRFGLVGQLI